MAEAHGPSTRPDRAVTPTALLVDELAYIRDRLAGSDDDRLGSSVRRAYALAAGLDPYIGRCATPESSALRTLSQRTRERDWGGRDAHDVTVGLEQEMLSGHVEGQLLKFLVHMTRARRVLEIGLFTGYSALAMAEAVGPDGTVVACEIDRDAARFARTCLDDSGIGDRVQIEVGPAQETLRRLDVECRDGSAPAFDLVFVDADKSGYSGYLRQLLDSSLLTPEAVIAVDNTLLQGEPYLDGAVSANGAAIADFNAALTYDERVEQVLVPIRDGLTLIRRVHNP